MPLSIYIAFGFSLAAKTLKTTNERHLQVAPAPVPFLLLQLQLQLACAASSSSCLHLLSDFFAADVVVAAIHTPKLLLLHECCKSKVGESHEGSADCDCSSSSGSGSRIGTKRSLFDWQAERITLAIIALVLHEQRKQQRRHHVTSAPSSPSLLAIFLLFAGIFLCIAIVNKKASSELVVGPKYGPNSTAAPTPLDVACPMWLD